MLMIDRQFSQYTPGVSEAAIASRVRNFVRCNYRYLQLVSIPEDDDRFFGSAALGQAFVGAMVNFIEDEFGVIVSPCEVNAENLGSLRAVTSFISGKQPLAVG
jgi:hypothetical protein